VTEAELTVLQEAAAAATLRFLRTDDSFLPELSLEDPLAIVVRAAPGTFDTTCTLVRRQASLFTVPVLGLATDRSDLAFRDLYHAGGDDLFDVRGIGADSATFLLRRLRALQRQKVKDSHREEHRQAPSPIAIGEDLPLHARAMANAGVQSSPLPVGDHAAKDAPSWRFIVASEEHARGALPRARAAELDTPWVIVVAPKRMSAVAAWASEYRNVRIMDALAPPENVLFIGNELAYAGESANARGALRSLFGTTVGFRRAGRDEPDEVGFSYNVSETGMYIRTLASVDPGDDVWIEMWAPRSSRRVRLVGTAVWQRAFGANDTASVPPGFGIRMRGGLPGDLEIWKAGSALLGHHAHDELEGGLGHGDGGRSSAVGLPKT
jgi:hypothetical protein